MSKTEDRVNDIIAELVLSVTDIVTPNDLAASEKAEQAILDWHNKQVENELKSIYGEIGHIRTVRECIDDRLAERNKLKESK